MDTKQRDNGNKVYVNTGNPKGIDDALRRLRKKLEKSNVLDIYKEKQFYVKPSVAKRKKQSRSRYLMQKYIEKQK